MKNRISALFSVILGALLITSCSSVFQPNKKVADIEVKASLSGTIARDITSSSDDDYSFIDEMLESSNYEDTFTYYQIIQELTSSRYGLTEDAAYDVLAEKVMENSSDFGYFSGYEGFWMQIKTNFGQESEKVYPFAKQMDLIKSYYKASIKTVYIYYSFLDEAGALLSDGQVNSTALAVYITNPDAEEKFENLRNELEASTTTIEPDFNPDLTTVSLKLNSVPFDQEVTFTLLINYESEADIKPYTFEFTRYVNPGLNVFDFTPDETTATGEDVIDDDSDGSGGDDEGDPDTDPVVEPDPDTVVDPWEDYTTYYVSNSPDEAANGSEDDPMSLASALALCTENYEETHTIYVLILKDDITISGTLKVQPSAYVVITGNYNNSIQTISAESDFSSHMFSIEDHANLGLSSV
nr:hypothetical protein [Treponema sp.]